MGQTTVYDCDKKWWLKVCFMCLALACVIFFGVWLQSFLPRWTAFLYAGMCLAMAVLSFLLAYSRYEVRGGRLFFIFPIGAKEIKIDRAQEPVVVQLKSSKRSQSHIYTRTTHKLLFEVTEHDAFHSDVKRLCAHDGDRKVSALQEYRGKRILAAAYLIAGILMMLVALVAILMMPSLPFFNTIILPYLVTGLVISMISALFLRNTKVVRDRETLSAYNVLGRKTRELKLGVGLHISGRKGLMYLECREGRFRIPLHVAYNKALIYDAFAIAEGDYEFVEANGSARRQ